MPVTVERDQDLTTCGRWSTPGRTRSRSTRGRQGPRLRREGAASRFGRQCIVVNIDPKVVIRDGQEVWESTSTAAGSRPAEAVAWVARSTAGAPAKLFFTSMDADGTKAGYDLPMTRAVADAVSPRRRLGEGRRARHLRAALAEGGAAPR